MVFDEKRGKQGEKERKDENVKKEERSGAAHRWGSGAASSNALTRVQSSKFKVLPTEGSGAAGEKKYFAHRGRRSRSSRFKVQGLKRRKLLEKKLPTDLQDSHRFFI